MPALSSLLIKRKVASTSDVQEALARQVRYGGDLVTNLLELCALDEPELTQSLAESFQLPPAPIGALPTSAHAVLGLVPGDVALRYGIYPMGREGDCLMVAVAEPMPMAVEDDVSSALGVRIEQHVTPLPRVRQAIARDYGLPLDSRCQAVLIRLQGTQPQSIQPEPAPAKSVLGAPDLVSLPPPPAGPPSARPGAAGPGAPAGGAPMVRRDTRPGTGAPPPPSSPPEPIRQSGDTERPPAMRVRPPSVAPPAIPISPAPIPKTATGGMPTSTQPVAVPGGTQRPTAIHATATQATTDSPQPVTTALRRSAIPAARQAKTRPKPRGPYTPARAEKDLLEAKTRDDVLSAFLHFASQYFEYTAIFAVHGDLAEGRIADGPGAPSSLVAGIGVPLDLPSSISRVIERGNWLLTRLEPDGLDADLANNLQRPIGKQILLLPTLVKTRCVLVLYGDHGRDSVNLEAVGDVLAFAPLVASALEHVIMLRKKAVRSALRPLPARGSNFAPRPPPAPRRYRAEPCRCRWPAPPTEGFPAAPQAPRKKNGV